MNIHLLSNRPVPAAFNPLCRARKHTVIPEPFDSWKELKKGGPTDGFYYVDVHGLKPVEITRVMRELGRSDGIAFGIYDDRGVLPDPAEVFFFGGLDYIGKTAAAAGITSKRAGMLEAYVERVIPGAMKPHDDGNSSDVSITGPLLIAPNGWDDITPESEYTFSMLYFALDDGSTLKADQSAESFHAQLSGFRAFVSHHIADAGGRIWLWKNVSGVALFPFDGSTCPAVVNCVRMMLSRMIGTYDHFGHGRHLSFRLALHIGNTLFRNYGETDTIVSDTINHLFHLGEKYAHRESFVMTDAVYSMTPEGLKPYFEHAGVFEGRGVYRMRLPRVVL